MSAHFDTTVLSKNCLATMMVCSFLHLTMTMMHILVIVVKTVWTEEVGGTQDAISLLTSMVCTEEGTWTTRLLGW